MKTLINSSQDGGGKYLNLKGQLKTLTGSGGEDWRGLQTSGL